MVGKRSLRFAVQAPVWQAQNVCRSGHAAWREARCFLGRIPKPTVKGMWGSGLTCTALSLKNWGSDSDTVIGLGKGRVSRKWRGQAVDVRFGVRRL